MNSLASRNNAEQRRQNEIRSQIDALQSQLNPRYSAPTPESPKRKRKDTELVPATPSPKKQKLLRKAPSGSIPPMRPLTSSSVAPKPKPIVQHHNKGRTSFPSGPSTQPSAPGPSKFLSGLASISQGTHGSASFEAVARTAAFSDKPLAPTSQIPSEVGLKRDESMAVVEDLEPGPVDIIPPLDDPFFKKLEPNSGIRLSSRSLPHEDLQEHLQGRFYLSPARLYSCIRLLPNKQGYEVPVPGDIVTIAVVAEQSPVKYSKAPAAADHEQDFEEADGDKKRKPQPKKASFGKKYVNMKLVDFANREKSSGTGGKAVIRGDALLSLLLFESDGYDKVKDDEGREKKVYRGGSKGAFEKLSKVKPGDVIALLNPRLLKPFTRSGDSPHPVNNILSVTPESGDSIVVIGRSEDLTHCSVVKRDGKPCGSWCDRRASGDICDYHVQHAVQSKRATRPEFAAGNSAGMPRHGKVKSEYDPSKKWGLKPEHNHGSSGATYVVSGHVISENKRSLVSADSFRDAEAKSCKSMEQQDKEIMAALLKHDKKSLKTIVKAQNYLEEERAKANSAGASKSSRKGNATSNFQHSLARSMLEEEEASKEDEISKRRLDALKEASSTRTIKLAASKDRPKVRSGVVVPAKKPTESIPVTVDDGMVNLDSDDD